jgi:glycosyltransferase involved in cell wall biosynthesis
MTVAGANGRVAMTQEMARSRVLHVLPDLQIGGGQTIVLNHILHADRDRFDLGVCYLGPDDDMRPAFVAAGVVPVHLGHRAGSGPRTVAALARMIRREQVDVVHVHSDIDRKYGQLASLLAGVPVVGHLHSEWVHFGPMAPEGASRIRRVRAVALGRTRDWIERRTVRQYIAESRKVRDLFAPMVDVPIAVLNQAIPLERFDLAAGRGDRTALREELGISREGPVLVNVSRLVPGKGQLRLVAVLDQLSDRWPDASLVLVGDGSMADEVRAEVNRRRLGHRVRLLGNRHDVPEILSLADVFVFASETEGFGLAVLEAMAASRPVVAFRLPALEEFARDGETSHLITPGDLDAFTNAVHGLLADPGRSRRMGEAGRRVVRTRYPSWAVARSFESVYDHVLDSRTANRRSF